MDDVREEYAVFLGTHQIGDRTFDREQAQHWFDAEAQREARRTPWLRARVELKTRQVSPWVVIESS